MSLESTAYSLLCHSVAPKVYFCRSFVSARVIKMPGGYEHFYPDFEIVTKRRAS